MFQTNRFLTSSFLLVLLCGAPMAEARVEFFSNDASISAYLDEGDSGSDGAGAMNFDFFSDSVSTNAGNMSAAASATFSVQSEPGGALLATCTFQTNSSVVPNGGPARAESYLVFSLTFTVSEEPEPFQLSGLIDLSHNGEVASSQATLNSSEPLFINLLQYCDDFNGCAPLSMDEIHVLEPATYALRIEVRTKVRTMGGTAGAAGSFTLTAGEGCSLFWTDPAGGDFSDSENWSPSRAPQDSGDGCDNLLFSEAGAYAVTLGDVSANSLTVLGGEPSLLGGSLALGGMDTDPALAVHDAARLTLESGSISAASADIGLQPTGGTPAKAGLPAFLRLKPGTTLGVTTLLETAVQENTLAELVLGDGSEGTTLSVLGDATLGIFGQSTVYGNGTLDLRVAGDLYLALVAGSDSDLFLNGSLANAGDLRPVTFFVGNSLVVGAEGSGTLNLTGAVAGEAQRLQVGALPGGDGTLNLTGANSALNIAGEALIGPEGTGDVSMADGALLTAASMRLGVQADSRGGLEAESASVLSLTGDLEVGSLDGGAGTLNVRDGARVEAANLTADTSNTEFGAGLQVNGDANPSRVEVSELLIVGGAGEGNLGMNGNATITAKDFAMGVLNGSEGQAVFLSGEGALEPVHSLQVSGTAQLGLDGEASLRSIGGASNTFGALWVGAGILGAGLYSAAGALNFTNVAGELLIGVQGRGTVALGTGGLICGACALGTEQGGLGVLRLESGASLRVEPPAEGEGELEGAKLDFVPYSYLEVGRHANGLVELFDAPSLLSCGEMVVGGDNPAAGGTLNIDTGATVDCLGSATLGANQGPALLRVANGANLGIASLLILGPKSLAIVGFGANVRAAFVSVEGRLEVVEEVFIARPEEEVKTAPAKVATGPALLDGDLTLTPGGVLSLAAGAGTALQVSGSVALDGTLEIVLPLGAAIPADDTLLNLMQVDGTITGAFAQVTLLNAPAGFESSLEFDGGLLRMRIVENGEGEGETPAEGEAVQEGEGESEGEAPAEGETAQEGEGEAQSEGEAPLEGETLTEGEGETAQEGESEGEDEGEVLAEGEDVVEGEDEGEAVPDPSGDKLLGCGTPGTKGDSSAADTMLVMAAMLGLFLGTGRKTARGGITQKLPAVTLDCK